MERTVWRAYFYFTIVAAVAVFLQFSFVTLSPALVGLASWVAGIWVIWGLLMLPYALIVHHMAADTLPIAFLGLVLLANLIIYPLALIFHLPLNSDASASSLQPILVGVNIVALLAIVSLAVYALWKEPYKRQGQSHR